MILIKRPSFTLSKLSEVNVPILGYYMLSSEDCVVMNQATTVVLRHEKFIILVFILSQIDYFRIEFSGRML